MTCQLGSLGAGNAGGNTLATGLLAYWTMNEASGNRADSTGNGNTLVQTGTVGTATGFGNVGNVLSSTGIANLYNSGNGVAYASLAGLGG
jgi:hypothetical protein